MSWERDELTKVIDENAHVDWFTGSPKDLAGDLIAAGYRKIFDGDCGLSSINDESDREAAEAWMRWANLVNIPEDGNGIAAMKQMLAEFGYKRAKQ